MSRSPLREVERRSNVTWDFTGRCGIVTGGSRGVGRATVLALARAGARVLFNYHSARPRADEVVGEAAQYAGEAVAVEADLNVPASSERLVEEARSRFGTVDFLVNNAGIVRDEPLYQMTDDSWRTVMDVNLTSVFRMTRRAIVDLSRSTDGRIVNMTSVAGLIGVPGQTNYCASKAGIIGFTRALAREVGRLGITVNAVAPGYIKTEMLQRIAAERRQEWIARVPLRRLGAPEDVCEAILFLLSRAAGYITGHVLVVDGGLI